MKFSDLQPFIPIDNTFPLFHRAYQKLPTACVLFKGQSGYEWEEQNLNSCLS